MILCERVEKRFLAAIMHMARRWRSNPTDERNKWQRNQAAQKREGWVFGKVSAHLSSPLPSLLQFPSQAPLEQQLPRW